MIGKVFVFVALVIALPAAASDIHVTATQAVATLLEALAPDFERASGDHLVLHFGLSGAIKKDIAAGATEFDVAILIRDSLDQLSADGKIQKASMRNIAASGVGIAVKQGAAKPPLANQQDFTALLLASNSIAFSASGGSGIYFQQLIDRLGLKDALAGKLRPQPGAGSGDLVARGEVQYAVQMISELQDVAGTELVGPLPPDLQMITTFTAGISARAANPSGAERLIAFLTAPERAAQIKARGLQPG